MRQWGKVLLACLLVVFVLQGAVFAQTTRFGGRITDADTGEPLPGANVFLVGTTHGTATDLGGSYAIVGAPAGTHTLRVSYLGYEEIEQEITLEVGKSTIVDVAMKTSFVEVEAVIVRGGQRSGQARALNQQRTAANIKNVVASDQIGRFPDPNVAEALQRISGIAVQRDQGEGRYITIRGTEPNLNNVMINGQRVPSPEGDVRSVALDVIPADQLGSIEVNKTLTPDMDGDAIGGSINLITRSALDYNNDIGSITLGGGYNNISSGGIGQGAFSYGTKIGANKNIGVLVSGSYYVTRRGSDNSEFEWGEEDRWNPGDEADEDEPGYVDPTDEATVLQSLELRDYIVTRTRSSFGSTVDYAWNRTSRNYLNFLWNEFGDQEYRRRMTFKVDKGIYRTDGTVDDIELERELKDRYEVQRIYSVGGGGKHVLFDNMIDLDYSAAYSYAEEEEPDHYDYTFGFDDDISGTLNVSDPDNAIFTPTSESYSAINDASRYEFGEVNYADNLTTDDELSLQANLKYHLNLGNNSGWLKTGFKYRDKSKDRKNHVITYEDGRDDDAPGYTPWRLSDVVENFDTGTFLDDNYSGYNVGLNVDAEKGEDFVKANLSDMDDETEYEDQDGENYTADETVYAGYLMGTMNFGSQWMLLTGARIEQTDLTYYGNRVIFDDEGDYLATTKEGGANDYMHVLPAVHLRYRFDDRTNFRVAWTNSIARPQYYDLVPYVVVNHEDEEVVMGNPMLDPAEAMNVDILAERYFSSLGIVSGGFFYKTISNYMYERVYEQNGGSYDGYEFTKPLNADEEATLMGFELAVNQQLTFLPGEFNGLGVYFNYTYTDSDVDFINEDGTVRTSVIPGQSEHIFNFALSYEKHGFSGRLGLNYTGKQILAVGEDEDHDEWLAKRFQVDFSASQRVWRSLRIYADVININNEPYVVYMGDEDHPIQREYYSFWSHIGFKYEF